MKILKTEINKREEVKDFPGLIKATFELEVAKVKCMPAWLGPKISPEAWNEVLAFFKWTNDTMHSESQVRAFVNPKEGKWGFWAFPQKAKTGMTATELPISYKTVEEAHAAATVRCEHWGSTLSDDWIYFGTVHHHCSGGAFQSSTDEANEKDQAGLHITVGDMDKKHHSLHVRFYLNKCCFEPEMDKFWDIGDARGLLPVRFHSEVALYQMGHQPANDQAFPDAWKENVIEEKVQVWSGNGNGNGLTTGHYSGYGGGSGYVYSRSISDRAEEALRRIVQSWEARELRVDPDYIWECFEPLTGEHYRTAFRIMEELKVDSEDLIKHAIPQYEVDLTNQLPDKAPKQIKDKEEPKKEDKKESKKEGKKESKKIEVLDVQHETPQQRQKRISSMTTQEWEEFMKRSYGCE